MPVEQEKIPKSLYALALLVLIAVIIVAFSVGRGCGGSEPVEVPDTSIDAGPGERAIADRLDAALQEADRRIAEIEREHAADLERFNEAQREKYEHLRRDPEAASEFIRQFNRRLRDAGGA